VRASALFSSAPIAIASSGQVNSTLGRPRSRLERRPPPRRPTAVVELFSTFRPSSLRRGASPGTPSSVTRLARARNRSLRPGLWSLPLWRRGRCPRAPDRAPGLSHPSKAGVAVRRNRAAAMDDTQSSAPSPTSRPVPHERASSLAARRTRTRAE
jgi:hypothetical protein